MSWGGILASGLAGGANAVGNITAGMIDQERRLQSAQVLSDIEEKKQMRIAERLQQMHRDQQTYNTRGQGGEELLGFARRTGEQANDVALKGEVAKASNPQLRQAAIDTETAKTKAKHDQEKELAIADANDPAYIGAVTKLKLADPEVAQRIAASRAQVAASGASVGLIQAQTEGVKLNNDDKKTLDKLYNDASTILSDTTIDDAERAKRYTKVSQQIVLMKSKTGQAAGRDPELDTQTVTEEKIDPETGNVTKTTRKEVRRPGSGGGAAKPTEAQAHAEAQAAIKQGKPADAINARLVELGYKPLTAAAASAKAGGILPAKPAADPITTLDERTLRQIAEIQGHKDQARARAELERRSSSAVEPDMAGIGFGYTGG